MLAQKGQHLAAGTRAAEAAEFLAVVKQDDSREPAHPVMAGQLHVVALVHFHLDQAEPAVQFRHQPFQHRRDHQAGRTPFGPEIDQQRPVAGSQQDVGLEPFDGGVDGVHGTIL